MHRCNRIRAGDGNRNASAHAGGLGFRIAGSIGLRAELDRCIRYHLQRAAKRKTRSLEYLRFRFNRGYVYRDRAAHADFALGISRLRLGNGADALRFAARDSRYRNIVPRRDCAALDARAVAILRHSHRNGHACADASCRFALLRLLLLGRRAVRARVGAAGSLRVHRDHTLGDDGSALDEGCILVLRHRDGKCTRHLHGAGRAPFALLGARKRLIHRAVNIKGAVRFGRIEKPFLVYVRLLRRGIISLGRFSIARV